MQKPDETTVKLDNPIFAQTDQIGVYTLLAEDQPLERFTVNLLSATESALPYPPTTEITDIPSDVENGLQPMTHEIWRWFALSACLFLLAEWWFYHRSRV